MSSAFIPLSAPAATCAATMAPIAAAAGLCASRPSASAARPWMVGSGSASAGVSADAADSSPIRPSANAAICRYFGVLVACQQRGKSRNSLGQADMAGRKRSASPHPALPVLQHGQQVTAPAFQLPLVLELQDPSQLLLVRGDWRRRRACLRRDFGPARTGGKQRDKRDQRAWRLRSGHRDMCRNVAWSIRSRTMVTPMPGPVGTAMVPSEPMSIAGSIKSGW